MNKNKKIFAIFIAYNAEKSLEEFFKNFPKHLFNKTILVDDASQDNTYILAKKLGIKSYRNPKNLGYGGNMKRAISIGLKLGGDILVDIHPDGEYKPFAIGPALKKINEGALFVLGNRFYSSKAPLKSGMYVWKYYPLRILNLISGLILGLKINDYHQGFRVYTKKFLNKVNYKSNSSGFLFSFELIAQAAYWKIPTAQVPVDTEYSGTKRGATLKKSVIYSLEIFWVLLLYILAKIGYKSSIFTKPNS